MIFSARLKLLIRKSPPIIAKQMANEWHWRDDCVNLPPPFFATAIVTDLSPNPRVFVTISPHSSRG
jgi:hypothetical protein